MKKFIFPFICFLSFVLIFTSTQGQISSRFRINNKIWLMGQHAGIKFDNNTVTAVQNYYHVVNSATGVNQVYDTLNDTLMFYSTGVCVFDQMNGQVNQTYPIILPTLSCDSVSLVGGMPHIILPSVSDSMSMHIMTFNVNQSSGYDLEILWSKLTYNGLYFEKKWETNVTNLGDFSQPYLAVVRHGNGRDYWILFHSYAPNNIFQTILFSDSAIQQTFTQSTGPVMSNNYMKFNHSGNKLAVCGMLPYYPSILFDFDRCTGLLSNPDTINVKGLNGLEFSPNDSLLYGTYLDSVFQYDLTNNNIPSTETLIYATKWFTTVQRGLRSLELAEDGKIYLSSYTGVSNNPSDTAWGYLDIIHRPDAPGTQCDYEAFAVYLDGNKCWGNLPYVFEYDKGPLVNSPCDTIYNTTGLSELNPNPGINIYPNPINDQLNVSLISEFGTVHLELINSLGATVLRDWVSGTKTISMAEFPSGIYLLKMTDLNNNLILNSKIIKL